jgi:hypothetical protein
MTMMPQDLDGNSIPVLGLRRTNGTHQVAITAASARNSTAFNASTRAITIYATVDCFVEFGSSTVTATNTRHFIPAATPRDLDLGGAKQELSTHLAVIRSTVDGTLYISELE